MKTLISLIIPAMAAITSCSYTPLITKIPEENVSLPYRYPNWGCDGSFSLSLYPQYYHYCPQILPQELPPIPFKPTIPLSFVPAPLFYNPPLVPTFTMPQGNLMTLPNPYYQTQRQ